MTSRPAADPNQLSLFALPTPLVVTTTAAEPEEGDLWGYFFATANGHSVKHGVTRDLVARQRALQTANAERLILTGAYPTYAIALEQAVGAYFDSLRKGGEWFEPWTIEFKITALGGGLPPFVFDEWVAAKAERASRFTAPGASVAQRVDELQRAGLLREVAEPDRVVAAALQSLVDRSPFEALQPLQVQVDQWWNRRLSGEAPFDRADAALRPAYVDLSQMRLGER
jgi:hypothetical protein